MKLLDLTCPNCGAKLSVNKDTRECHCNSCGGTFLLDDETQKQQIDYSGAEEAGYQFELGRQKAQKDAKRQNDTQIIYNTVRNDNKKDKSNPSSNHILLWILAFLCCLPIPITILVYRSKRLSNNAKLVIITFMWAFVLVIGLMKVMSNGSSAGDGNVANNNNNNITSLELSYMRSDEVEMTVGDEPFSDYINASVHYGDDLSSDDVVFISENPDIATISFTEIKYSSRIYYTITPISEGETYVYATSADGSVSTEKIHIIVHGIIEAESITFEEETIAIVLDETLSLVPSIYPEDTADKSLSWDSSDESIVTVDTEGQITGISAGEAVITATTSNGLGSSCTVTVDDSQRVMNLSISRERLDDNNIGDEWSHTRQINGESVSNGPYTIAVGDTLTIYVKASEDDAVPDVGESTVTHTITEDDFENGFSIDVEVYATENGGQNSGQSAHFITTFSFEIQ